MSTPTIKYCACGCNKALVQSPATTNSMFQKLMFIVGHNSKKPKAEPHLCGCGCGEFVVQRRGMSPSNYKKIKYIKGHQSKDPAYVSNIAEKIRSAHKRGLFDDGCKTRKEKTLSARPKCKCGCGKPVRAKRAVYAVGCFDATTPENRAIARSSRDMVKLKAENSIRMTQTIQRLKESGEYEKNAKRHSEMMTGRPATGKLKKGKLDHLQAKAWKFRDTMGVIHTFSNLKEWARKNEYRFIDDRPNSKMPFCLRIAAGLGQTLASNGNNCSYRGWVAVSKLELNDGGFDLLGRDYFTQNNL